MRKQGCCSVLVLFAAAYLLLWALPAGAADWPAYKADAARSSFTPEKLRMPLSKVWTYEPAQSPRPAWPQPGRELHRIDFDYAFQPVAAGGMVYFGSSADDSVRALDAATGALKWRFATGGPVRLAPAVWQGKCYVGSDDGLVYCLDAATGKELWRFRGGPRDARMIGNGRMISRWPVRSGVLVDGGVAYFAAGMWPSEGVYVYALDARDGHRLWCNDTSGSMYIDTPHTGASAFTGVCPQGYMLAGPDVLLVPTGRAVPAAYDRKTGRLLHYLYADGKFDGGSWCTLAGDTYLSPSHPQGPDIDVEMGESGPRKGDGLRFYDLTDGEKGLLLTGKHRAIIHGDTMYAVGSGEVMGIDLVLLNQKVPLKGCTQWKAEHPRGYCMALADETLLVGGRGTLTAYDTHWEKEAWLGEVAGQVRGLAVADGRVLAATDKGTIVCFAYRELPAKPARIREELKWSGAVPSRPHGLPAEAVARLGASEGYALIIGQDPQEDLVLAMSLAWQTRLHVIQVARNAPQADALRQRLLTTNLYGSRVAVQAVERLDALPFAPYFADLIVVRGQADGMSGKELYRLLRPCGGVMCLAGMSPGQADAVLKDAGISPQEVVRRGESLMIVRGKLPGAGEWRYQWADPGHTGIGADTRVRLPLELLWFGGPGPMRMVSRHWGTSAPLSVDGRVFVTGQHDVIAFNAYNGAELWSRELRDVGRVGAEWVSANFVADNDSLYAAVDTNCYRLDQATGNVRAVYGVPGTIAPRPATQTGAEQAPLVDVKWPATWQVSGPLPKGSPALEAEQLKSIPAQVTLKGKTYAARPLDTVRGVLDFTSLYGGYGLEPLAPGAKAEAFPRGKHTRDGASERKAAYAFAKVRCPTAGRLVIAASADWWMDWYLDGKGVYDTLQMGNAVGATDVSRHVFAVEVSAGEHVLAVRVEAGSMGWSLASVGGSKYQPLLEARTRKPPPRWGYLCVVDDLVLGSYDEAGDWESEGSAVFALGRSDGAVRWSWRPRGTVANNAIATGAGRVFLLDTPPAKEVAKAKRRGGAGKTQCWLVACDLAKGTELWRTEVPLESVDFGQVHYAEGVVVLSAQAAYDAKSGQMLWKHRVRPDSTALIRGDWLIAEPYAYDLRTGRQRTTPHPLSGEPIPWTFLRSYGCGSVTGCRNMLFYRSGVAGLYDFAADGVTNFGGVRPGCSANIIAANGLVIMPESAAACTCSYNYQTSLALVPKIPAAGAGSWYVLSGQRGFEQAKAVRLNLGAPGDRRDGSGAAWLSFPRPGVPGACPVNVEIQAGKEPQWYVGSSAADVKGTDRPWLYAFGLEGVEKITVDLGLAASLDAPTRASGKKPPKLDARLDDDCWKGLKPAAFERKAHLRPPRVTLLACRDKEHLYLAFHRGPVVRKGKLVPLVARQEGTDAPCSLDDSLTILLTDGELATGLEFAVSCAGGQLDSLHRIGEVFGGRSPDTSWDGQWTHSVRTGDGEWWAEIAIPLATLAEAKLDTGKLLINASSRNRSGVGAATIWLARARSTEVFDRRNMLLLADTAASHAGGPSLSPRTVRLHFAETQGLKPGERVFSVAIEGKEVLKDFDVAQAAGGPMRAIVKEFKGIRPVGELEITFTPKVGEPSLAAVEVIAE